MNWGLNMVEDKFKRVLKQNQWMYSLCVRIMRVFVWGGGNREPWQRTDKE